MRRRGFVVLTAVMVVVVVGVVIAHGVSSRPGVPYGNTTIGRELSEVTLTVLEVSPTKPLILAKNTEGELFVVDVSPVLQWGLPRPGTGQTIVVKGYLSSDFETLHMVFAQSITIDGKTYTAVQQWFWPSSWNMPCYMMMYEWYEGERPVAPGGYMMPGMMGW